MLDERQIQVLRLRTFWNDFFEYFRSAVGRIRGYGEPIVRLKCILHPEINDLDIAFFLLLVVSCSRVAVNLPG